METELRLGLPGNEGDLARKRGFSETVVDLKLNLASSNDVVASSNNHKDKNNLLTKPPAKAAQVVGWPPVRSFRKNILSAPKKSENKLEESEKVSGGASFVKVSMDGAPFLRKVDLKMYKSYQELSDALAKMFGCFTTGDGGVGGMKDYMNEKKGNMNILSGSDYVASYEDKDGDWMLVGDVPWEMFVESCKRLRIMKGTEVIGFGPRAVEKHKNSS